MKENKNKEEKIIKKNATLKNVKSIKSFKSSNSGIGKNNSIKNEFLKRTETTVDTIKKLINKINRDLIYESVENTLKDIKDRAKNVFNNKPKDNESAFEGEKNDIRKKLEKKAKKKEEMYKVKIEEDLPYEKEIRRRKEKMLKTINAQKEQRKKELKLSKFKSKVSKRAFEQYKEEKMKELNQEQIGDDLTFMSDLSLSNINQSFALLRRVNSIKEHEEEKYDSFDEKSFIEKKDDILKTEEKLIDHENDELEDKVNFGRPRAILSSILALQNDAEIKTKLDKLRDKFNIHQFLRKEAKKGNNLKNVGRRKSFLNFLEYTNKPDDFEIYLENENKKRKKENQVKQKRKIKKYLKIVNKVIVIVIVSVQMKKVQNQVYIII